MEAKTTFIVLALIPCYAKWSMYIIIYCVLAISGHHALSSASSLHARKRWQYCWTVESFQPWNTWVAMRSA